MVPKACVVWLFPSLVAKSPPAPVVPFPRKDSRVFPCVFSEQTFFMR